MRAFFAGALTVFFFFSQSCHICHDVAPTLSELHKKYADKGLQVRSDSAALRCSATRRGRAGRLSVWPCALWQVCLPALSIAIALSAA